MSDVDIPVAVALKSVPDVELVAVGSWNASTGKAVITDDDVHQAVAALDCPGVHNPVLKLGHEEPDPDENKIRWDGTPAVGWISNMRLSDNEAKILGDYTGVPAWLVDVMPSAYPQRSVEIQRDHLCQIGHVHPFVITAVSLLGIYPPAVGVIKSLQDVQALYTLAAADNGRPGQEVYQSIALAVADRPADDERRPLTDDEIRSTVDFDKDRDEWEASIAALLSAWPSIGRAQRDQLAAQIVDHVDQGHLDQLAGMDVDSQAAVDLIYNEMLRAAYEARDEQAAEARRQGVTLDNVPDPDTAWLRDVAAGIAVTMAASLAATAGRDAAQLAGPGLTGTEVSSTVAGKLAALSDRWLTDQFAGAIGSARSAGRYAVLSAAPQGRYQAAEVNDVRTCGPCKSIDGQVFDGLDEALSAYGSGGYQSCSGGGRCRGRYITVWEVDAAPLLTVVPALTFTARIPTTVSLSTGGQPMPLPTTIKAKVSAEDISRAYYKTAGYSKWITAMHVDPLELVVCDDGTGDYDRVPVTLSGDEFEFGEPVRVAVEYVDVKTPSGGDKVKARALVYASDSDTVATLSAFAWPDRAAALSIVGGEPAPTPATNAPPAADPASNVTVAAGVTPAGAAIRKMAAATQTPTAAPADGITSTQETEASGMPFDADKLREALGLSEGANANEALTAFAGALAALGGGQTPAPATTPANTVDTLSAQALAPNGPPVVPARAQEAGAVLLDPDALRGLQESARKGETAWAQLRRNERDGLLDEAIRLGKFPAARRDQWSKLWDHDPDGTRQAISALAANVIPVLSAGYLGDDSAHQTADRTAYEGLFGKDA